MVVRCNRALLKADIKVSEYHPQKWSFDKSTQLSAVEQVGTRLKSPEISVAILVVYFLNDTSLRFLQMIQANKSDYPVRRSLAAYFLNNTSLGLLLFLSGPLAQPIRWPSYSLQLSPTWGPSKPALIFVAKNHCRRKCWTRTSNLDINKEVLRILRWEPQVKKWILRFAIIRASYNQLRVRVPLWTWCCGNWRGTHLS